MVKIVSGTITPLIAETYIHLYSKRLEVRKSGTTYQLFYNGAQVGTDQTIVNSLMGSYFGLYQMGPEASSKEFYIGPYNATPAADTGINAATPLTTPTYDSRGKPLIQALFISALDGWVINTGWR